MFLFQKHSRGSILLSIVHNDTMESGNVLSCSIISIESLSNNTKTRFTVSVVLSCLKVEKKYIHVYCYRGKALHVLGFAWHA